MKKIISIIVCISTIFCLLFTSCRKETYRFLNDESEISCIEIISLKYSSWGSWDSNESKEEILICKINDVSNFLDDFSKINVDSCYPPPDRYDEICRQTVIKITYNNGEYELIFPAGKERCEYKDGDLTKNFSGILTLDNAQFADLVTKYVQDDIKLEYNFLHRNTRIAEIQIVQLNESLRDYAIPEEQLVIEEIENIPEFLGKFSKLDCYFNSNLPTRVQDDSIAIKIIYQNEDYELIDAQGQSTLYDSNFTAFGGFRYFNQEQFSNLIQEYINK